MDSNEVAAEARKELAKADLQLAEDLIREAVEGNRTHDDSVKHLLKRVGLHQLVLAHQARRTNRWLIGLSLCMAIGSIASVISMYFTITAHHCP